MVINHLLNGMILQVVVHPRYLYDTVDGRSPEPVDMVNIRKYTGFHTSEVVQDSFHKQYSKMFVSSLFNGLQMFIHFGGQKSNSQMTLIWLVRKVGNEGSWILIIPCIASFPRHKGQGITYWPKHGSRKPCGLSSLKRTYHLKKMVGRLLSLWEGLFSWAMLVSVVAYICSFWYLWPTKTWTQLH